MVFQNYALYPQQDGLQEPRLPAADAEAAEGRDRPQGARGRARCSTSPTCSSASRANSRAASSSAWRSAARWCAIPRVFLMDEPLSNLDAKLRVQMRSEIKRFHQDLNATIIYVTHDQLEAVTMADKMAVMNGGVLQQYDTPAQRLRQPGEHLRRQLRRQPGDEPRARSRSPARGGRDGADQRRGLGAAALARERAQGPHAPRRARSCSARGTRRSGCTTAQRPAPSRAKVYTVEPTGDVTFVQVFVSGAVVNVSLAADRRGSRPTSTVWLEFDQDADAPVRWRNRHGAARRDVMHMLKITAIKPFPVWVGIRNQLIVKVETDEGIYGWGESGLSGREKAVVGAIEHYREFLIGRTRCRSARSGRRCTAASISRAAACCRPRSRPSTSRSTTSRARRSACRSTSCWAASSATSSRPSPRRADARGPEMIEQARELMAQGWNAIRLSPAGPRTRTGIYEPRESIAETAKWCDQGARGAGRRRRPRHRLPPPPVASPRPPASARRCRAGTLDFLEEPIRDETPEAYEALRTHDRRPLRHRRGVRLEVAVPALHRARHPPVQPASTSAMSAA